MAGKNTNLYVLIKTSDYKKMKTEKEFMTVYVQNEFANCNVVDLLGDVNGKIEELTLLSFLNLAQDTISAYVATSSFIQTVELFLQSLDFYERIKHSSDFSLNCSVKSDGKPLLIFNMSDNTLDLSNFRRNINVNEFVGSIVDVCEDFLEKYDVVLKNNSDKQKAIADGENPEFFANIYGSDYDLFSELLTDNVTEVIEDGILYNVQEAEAVAGSVVALLGDILTDNQANKQISELNTKELYEQLIETFKLWGLLADQPCKYVVVMISQGLLVKFKRFKTYDSAYNYMARDYNECIGRNTPIDLEVYSEINDYSAVIEYEDDRGEDTEWDIIPL